MAATLEAWSNASRNACDWPIRSGGEGALIIGNIYHIKMVNNTIKTVKNTNIENVGYADIVKIYNKNSMIPVLFKVGTVLAIERTDGVNQPK